MGTRKIFRDDNFFNKPIDGDIVPLKFLCIEHSKYGANESAEEENLEDPRYIRITDITDDGALRMDIYKSLSLDKSSNYLLKEGDLLFARSGATVGKTFLYKEVYGPAVYAGYLVKYRLNLKLCNPEYINYCTKSNQYKLWLKYTIIEATIENISGEKYANLSLPIPSLAQQKKIVVYLDQEVTKIDALIEKKTRLVELLEEKKKATISQAVNKGLNPNIKMKSSGIDWLGDIPEHWKLVRLKYLSDGLKYGANEAAEEDNPDFPRYIRITDIDENGNLKPETFKSISLEIANEYLLEDGDILFARSGATVGKTFRYTSNYGKSAYAGYLIRMRPNRKIDSQFMYYFTLSNSYWSQIYIDSIQATIQNFSGDKYANMLVTIPSNDEQIQIAKYLDNYIKQFSLLRDKVTNSIDLLKEKRTAIISSTINGEINLN